MALLTQMKNDYQTIFVEEWSPYLAAVLLVVVSSALVASGGFWGVYGGIKNWGDWLNTFIGLENILNISNELAHPLESRISILNMCLMIGAFSAALISRQFRINRPPKLEYISGAIGGTLMGIGATLSMGCNVGAFFTPVTFSSPSGWAMWVGLLAGAFIGLKLLLWIMENISWGTKAPEAAQMPGLKKQAPWGGVLTLLLVGWWTIYWLTSDDRMLSTRALYIPCGFAFGFIMHRARFCFSRSFREPFLTGEGDITKAVMLAILLAVLLFSVFFSKEISDPYVGIPPSFWSGSLFGGLIFGIGMILAGGCATGSLWRVGEGHLKLVVAVFFFSWSASTFSGILKYWNVLTREDNLDLMVEETTLGYQAWMPQLFDGWGWSHLATFSILVVWFLLVRYNEKTEKFTVI
ncbi:MAG: YeeE/YedE family protein [Gammaproteobacteria bacterium]|nr:YeeE/YedE family protein [Gammaproteobacteria bacterium]